MSELIDQLEDINNTPLNNLKIKTSHNSYAKQKFSFTPNQAFTKELLEKYYFRALEVDLDWDKKKKIPLANHFRIGPLRCGIVPLERFLKVIIDFKDKQPHGFNDPIFIAFERQGKNIDDEMWKSIFEIIDRLINSPSQKVSENFELKEFDRSINHLILPSGVNQSGWGTLGQYRESEYSKLILTTHDELIDPNSPFRKYLHIDNLEESGNFRNYPFIDIGMDCNIKPSQISDDVAEGILVRIFPPGGNSMFTGSVRAVGLIHKPYDWWKRNKKKLTVRMKVKEVLDYPAQMIAMDDWDNILLDKNFQVQNEKGEPVRSGFIRNYLSIDNSKK